MPSIGTIEDCQGQLGNTYLIYVTLNNPFFFFFLIKKEKEKGF